jgi:amino acid transporter
MSTTTDRKSQNQVNDTVRLSRALGPFTVTMMGVGGMIGAGIFALTGIAAGEAGPAVILVFVLNGVVTLLTALAYAELGSAFPRAGGGYVWVKEGLGGANGFLAGWMSWSGYIVAGALYGIAFGGFAAHAWQSAGMPSGGLSEPHLAVGFTVFIVILFTAFNFFGAKEAGAMGNLVTLAKIAILGLFVVFGLVVMVRSGPWELRFTEDFMPNGVAGVVIAMGLTFIAFEGYEIIAQSGEEIIDPKRNIPRGIFVSIAIAVAIYVLVGVVAIGATIPPAGTSVYAFLGEQKELAVVSIARQIFPFGIGGALMLISGLAATMSALNVTVYSASRVSFAMGREHNLPDIFARIHPRRLTPYVSVFATGTLMLGVSLTLPIETVATAGGLMFLTMFMQVNLALMALKVSRPEVKRGFNVPFFPLPNLIAIAANAALVLYMITFEPVAVWTAFGWIVVGLLFYYMYVEEHETLQKPKEVVLEETLGEFAYPVLVCVRDEQEAGVLARFGAAVAKAREGGLVAVHMLEVPPPLSLDEGRHLLESGLAYFKAVRAEAEARGIGIHTLMMISRRVSSAVAEIARERRAALIVLGFKGASKRGRTFGRTIDLLIGNPPADLAIVRPAQRAKKVVETILVPVDAGANSRLAVELATDIGRVVAGRKIARITLLRVVRTKAEVEAGSDPLFEKLREGIDYRQIEAKVVQATSVVNTVLDEAERHDLVIFGASEEPLLKRVLAGNRSRRILRRAKPLAVMVKRRHRVLHWLLRRAVLPSPSKSR